MGTAISSAFLFLIAIINIFFLIEAIKARRRLRRSSSFETESEDEQDTDKSTVHAHGGGLFVRIIGPVLRTVDRPWKLYPVGVLFGLGQSRSPICYGVKLWSMMLI